MIVNIRLTQKIGKVLGLGAMKRGGRVLKKRMEEIGIREGWSIPHKKY